jgi:hypothetical protein
MYLVILGWLLACGGVIYDTMNFLILNCFSCLCTNNVVFPSRFDDEVVRLLSTARLSYVQVMYADAIDELWLNIWWMGRELGREVKR